MASFTQLDTGNWSAKVRKINKRTGLKHKESESFPTKKEAQAWAKALESDLDRGIHHDLKKLDDKSLAAEIQDYMDKVTIRKIGAKQETVRLKKWLTHEWAGRAIHKISSQEIIDHIALRRKTITVRKKPVSEQTIKHELIALSNVFEYAISKGMEIINPVKAIGRQNRPAGSRSLDIRIPPTLQPKLFKKLEEQTRNPMFLVISELAIETALRQGEFFRLKKSDIKLKEGYLIATDQVNKNNTITLNTRIVPLSPRAKVLLEFTKKIRDPEQLIFEGTSADGLSRAFTKACKTVKGLEKATFHATRHEACSRLAPHFDIHILMKLTGHKSSAMLARYFNPSADDIVKVFNKTLAT